MPLKGENIYKRKDGRWEARYILEHREDRSVRYGYCYGKTYREAKQKQAEARNSINPSGKCRQNQDHHLHTVLDDWLHVCQMRVKESTFTKYQGMIQRHIVPFWHNCSVAEISVDKVEAFAHHLLIQKGLASKTVRDILTLFHAVTQYAATRFPGSVTPVHPTYPRSERKETRVLSREEQRRLVSYLTAEADPCKFGVLLALMTGIRIGELCALRWSDICKEDHTVQITATIQRITDPDPNSKAKTKLIFSSPKSDHSLRRIPLTGRAAALCEENRCADPEAYVLTGMRGAFMEPRTLQYRFQQYARACAIEGIHLHTLRHTFATRCVEVDFEIKALSEILGHSSPRITLDRYVHASMQHKRENMRKLDLAGL